MNAKTLYGLAVATFFALVAAIWINHNNQPRVEDSELNAPLFPGLRDQINSVDSITLSGAGGKVLTTLKRGVDGWSIAERSGYPADISKVREFLLKLADAAVLEQKTANPKRYAELGVEDVTNDKCDPSGAQKCPDAKGALVELGGLKRPLKLIVGLYNGAAGGGTFVRRDGDAQSLLVKGNLLAEKDPGAWIRHELADIDAGRIKEVTLTGLDGKTLHIYKAQSADGNFRVADVPQGRELASDYVANSLGSGLSNLRADDVALAKDAPASALVYKVHYLGFGGLAVDLLAWEDSGKNRIQLVASNDPAQLDADIVAGQTTARIAYETAVAAAKVKAIEAKGDDAAIAKAEADVAKPPSLVDPAKDRAERQAAAEIVVTDLNKTFAGWTFTVPAYEFTNFNKGIEELLRPLATKPLVGVKPSSLLLPGQGGTTPAKPRPMP